MGVEEEVYEGQEGIIEENGIHVECKLDASL